ncbi:ribonuclease HI family protein [Nicoliella spurrieriana]|uniref:Ribonuclease HI family protein n=1 Tax=Nicoliella spurrieriana TaxID=2925830 RepID=A0A976RRV3_9LACO|nr:ribonuclease HI family protein [Nicoliella spurrieriana]UQS86605.1 ribonuclease HI family protein [Nicoliella spurrieriana]
MYKLYTDAATLNHGDIKNDQSAGGILILNNGHQLQMKVPLRDAHDNHTAEFTTCIAGLRALIEQIPAAKLSHTIVFYYTDSKILADSLDKQYAKHYQPFVDSILALEAKFQLVMNQWIPEAQNMGAHELAQQALHQFR